MQQALVVLVAERLLDALTLITVALIVLPPFFRATGGRALVEGLATPGTGALIVLSAGLAVGLVALGVTASVRWHALKTLIIYRLQSLRADILAVVQRPPRHLALLGSTTVLSWTATFLLHYAIFEALDTPGSAVVNPLLLAVVVTLSTNLAMLAPATPGGIGIVHAAAAAPLLVAGLSSEVAVAYAILVHAMNTVPPMLVGAACLGVPSVLSRRRGATT